MSANSGSAAMSMVKTWSERTAAHCDWQELLGGVYEEDGKILGGVEKDQLVRSAGELFRQIVGGALPDYEEMGLNGDAAFVVHNTLVAIKGKTVFHVAPHAIDRNDGGRVWHLRERVRHWSRRVRQVKQMTVAEVRCPAY